MANYSSGDAVGQDKIFADPTFRPPTWLCVVVGQSFSHLLRMRTQHTIIVLCFALCAIALSDVMNVNYNAMTKDIASFKKLLTHRNS